MTQHEIVALRCPSCGAGITEPSHEMPFGAEFRCEICSITSVLIIDRALVPLGTIQSQGEKVCTTCGRIAIREARFCQEGHALTKRCFDCLLEFSIDHQRCDFCGRLQSEASSPQQVPQLNEVYQGTITRIVDFGAFVEILPGVEGLLHISEIANHAVRNVHDELKDGDKIEVKMIGKEGNKIKLSSKVLGRP